MTNNRILTIVFFRYRRSFDSEYSAPLVAYYIWPALMDGATVVAKGEAFTKRGAVSSIFHYEINSMQQSSADSYVRTKDDCPSNSA